MKGNKSKLGQSRLTEDVVLSLLLKGKYLKEIMHDKHMSKSQVDRRLRQIYKKHGVKDRVSLLLATGRLVKAHGQL